MKKLTVTTAKPLSDKQRAFAEKSFAEKYGDFTVEYLVDDALVGGIVVFDGDTVYDGSVSKQLGTILERIKGSL